MAEKQQCMSTHGGAGYTFGDYWDGDAIVCIICGMRIENPRPPGWHEEYKTVWTWRWPFRRSVLIERWPRWPGWIIGSPGRPLAREQVLQMLRGRRHNG